MILELFKNFKYCEFKIFCGGFILRETSHEMVKSLCRLLIEVKHGLVENFYVPNISFKAICKNRILLKIYEFTVLIV